MKYFILAWIIACLLSGCGARPAMETISDELVQPAAAVQREVYVELPGEAAVPAMESGSSRYYLCDDYEISVETYPSGDLRSTVQKLCGYVPEDLTVVETRQDGVQRYDFVWAAAGENGERLGRAAILDDGNYHYTLSVLRDADNTEKLQVVWRTVFESFRLA